MPFTFDLNQDSYQPGATISGNLSWDLNRQPKKITISLEFCTKGTGDEDQIVVASETLPEPFQSGRHPFSSAIPIRNARKSK